MHLHAGRDSDGLGSSSLEDNNNVMAEDTISILQANTQPAGCNSTADVVGSQYISASQIFCTYLMQLNRFWIWYRRKACLHSRRLIMHTASETNVVHKYSCQG